MAQLDLVGRNTQSDITHFEWLYQLEVLGVLNPRLVHDELQLLAGGKVPVMVCWERAGGPTWCHRALAARWLADALGIEVPEFGLEHLDQADHPLMAPELRRQET